MWVRRVEEHEPFLASHTFRVMSEEADMTGGVGGGRERKSEREEGKREKERKRERERETL